MTGRGDGRRARPRRERRWLAAGFRLAVVATVLLVAGASAASAAGSTSVALEATSDDVAVGETLTVDLVVSSTDEGVGGFVADLDLGNPNVAEVVDVQFHGDPGMSDVVYTDDGARFGAVLMDTSETGSVTVAAVTLEAKAPGSTQVGLEIDPLADEEGNVYDVQTSGAVVQATGDGEPAAPPDDEGSDASDDEIDLGGFGSDDGDEPSSQASGETSTEAADDPSAATNTAATGTSETETTAPATAEPETTVTRADGQPGFGLLVGGVSLTIAALLARRLRR